MDGDLWRWDAVDLAAAIRTGKISSREATESILDRLAAVNPALNAVTVLLADEALAVADTADAAVRRGESLGPLHGVPVTIKENIDQAGTATANGVPAFKDLVATVDSPVVANLRAAGAVIIGRTNTPAFSIRWDTDNDLRGRTFNPWAKERTPGGSSGGAAAALAAGIAPLAHGNDLGGSVRYPAYCCGVAGIRPTLGRVAAYNATAAAERGIGHQLLSVQGVLARRIGDVRLGLASMTARDPRDPWWVPAPLEGPAPAAPVRVALTVNPAGHGVDPAVADAVRGAGAALAAAGYAVEEVEPPSLDAVVACWAAIITTEARRLTHADVRRYGGEAINRTLDLGAGRSPELDLDGYMRALAMRSKHVRDWTLFMERYPLVVGPVSTEPPFLVGFDTESRERTDQVFRAQRLLIAVNLLGFPAVAVPTGVTNRVPLGVQVIGARYREDLCLDAAAVIETRAPVSTPIDPLWR